MAPQMTNNQLALNMISASQQVASVIGWSSNYSAPKDSSVAFDLLIDRFYKNATQHKAPPTKINDAAKELLVLRERLEKQIYKSYPKIDKEKFKSDDCESEIKKITDPQVAYQLGTLDLLIGLFFHRGVL